MVVLFAPALNVANTLVNGLLAVKPLANLAKHRARKMMIKRAESIGVNWRQDVKKLRSRGKDVAFDPGWETELAAIQDPDLVYPDYYLKSFHAYEKGNLCWEAATEVAVAAQAVHARLWPEEGAAGTLKLRQNFIAALQTQLSTPPQQIVDLGCSVGISTRALQVAYPQAEITGVDLSPHFLAVAQFHDREAGNQLHNSPAIQWRHAAAESTGLPDQFCDIVTAFLVVHELPQPATRAILREARRLLRPGGHLAIMDSNPKAEGYSKMPPYVLTLLKSTEPYLDEYFSLDIERAMEDVGFLPPSIFETSPRHYSLIAQVCETV